MILFGEKKEEREKERKKRRRNKGAQGLSNELRTTLYMGMKVQLAHATKSTAAF